MTQVRGIKFDKENIGAVVDGILRGRKSSVRYKRNNGDVIRYLPFKDGEIIKIVYLHYKVGPKAFFVCPRTVGERCKVCEEGYKLLKKSKEIGNEEEAKAVRRSASRLVSFETPVMPCLVRNRQTEKIVMLDFLSKPFSKFAQKENEFEKVLNWIKDPDIGNITDYDTGRDVKLTGKEMGTKEYKWVKWGMELKLTATKLANSPEELEEFKAAVPDIFDIGQPATIKESEVIFQDMLDGVAAENEVMEFPPKESDKSEESPAEKEAVDKALGL